MRAVGLPTKPQLNRLYPKWDYREVLAKQATGIIQPDLTWVGGIIEAKKPAAMAAGA